MLTTTQGSQTRTNTYNGDDVLVTQLANGTTTRYTQDLASPLSQVLQTTQGSATTHYLYGLERLASRSGATRTWYVGDALGSVRRTLDDTGAVLGTTQYDSWGTLEGGAAPSPFGFTGEVQDTATGLVNLRARWYSSSRGTFTTFRWRTDESNDEIPYSHHGYAYALSNPLLYTDPYGTCAVTDEQQGCAGHDGRNFGARVLQVLFNYNMYGDAYTGRPLVFDATSAAYRYMDAHPGEALAYVPPYPQGPADPELATVIHDLGFETYETGIQQLIAIVWAWQADHGKPIAPMALAGAFGVVVPFGVEDCISPYALNGGAAAYGGRSLADYGNNKTEVVRVPPEQPPFNPNGTLGAARVWTTKARLKDALLPTRGKIRYIPPKSWEPSQPLPRGPNHGYLDRYDNEWLRGPSRTPGEPFEWDVQLGRRATPGMRKLSPDGAHVNVSLGGEVTH